MINLGKAARHLRTQLGLSQRAAGAELGISYVHLHNIENEKASPTAALIEKYYETFGVDLYLLAVVLFADDNRIPEAVRASADDLRTAWREEIEQQIEKWKVQSA